MFLRSNYPFFLFCELSLTLDDAILFGQPNVLVLTQSIYWHHGHVEWSILLLLRRYYKWWLSSFWERDCVGPPGQSWLLHRQAYLRAELVWLAMNQTNKQMRNESSRGVLQQVRLGTILRVSKTRKPRVVTKVMSLASSKSAYIFICFSGLALWNRSTKTIRQLVIKLALPGTELCAVLIAFEFDDSGAGLLSLLASFWGSFFCGWRPLDFSFVCGCGLLDLGFTPWRSVWWRLPFSSQVNLSRQPADMWPLLKQP